ncbi:hypothetical protein WICPIJ_005022 [Wickerhamomyces pijperi]|uniref:Uncharacterized protein n=1 Tax=Wickerhamomyces pijperi TaxID=599730 RepID=A0A9P8Q706_WICPI|nr:hypothetical protein WICPIJ_005022 [Wickerhamomyces pijperi]
MTMINGFNGNANGNRNGNGNGLMMPPPQQYFAHNNGLQVPAHGYSPYGEQLKESIHRHIGSWTTYRSYLMEYLEDTVAQYKLANGKIFGYEGKELCGVKDSSTIKGNGKAQDKSNNIKKKNQ